MKSTKECLRLISNARDICEIIASTENQVFHHALNHLSDITDALEERLFNCPEVTDEMVRAFDDVVRYDCNDPDTDRKGLQAALDLLCPKAE